MDLESRWNDFEYAGEAGGCEILCSSVEAGEPDGEKGQDKLFHTAEN